MSLTRSLVIRGQQVGPYVSDWGSIDTVKDLLLAQTQLFAGQYQVKLFGTDALFSPYAPGSLFYGWASSNQIATMSLGGNVAYNGIIKAIEMDGQRREVTVTMVDYFSKPCSIIASAVGTGVNPAAAMVTLFENAGLGLYLNFNSFESAGAAASAAGATVNVNWTGSSSTSVLAAVQALSQLASIQVFILNGQIWAQAWTPYQGNSAGIKGTLDSASGLVRSWGDFTQAYDNLNNSVTVAYGASSTLTLINAQSVNTYGIKNGYSFSTATGQPLAVPDQISAQYFAQTYLARASTLKGVVQCECGPELLSVANLGDRWLVTSPNMGMTAVPMEIIETHKKISANGVGLKLVTV